uniref:Integrase catalytic domain-containing protein n=1 Tax=Gouania willdenowi TaxID=441366 RepID=A0A8C5GKQ1_GOUWI
MTRTKSMFARHGIPETLITDNGPQFSCREMEHFAKEYCFEHVTSSPRYPQSNGEVERAVRTVKDLLKKASDPYRALLAYRTTALANGYSPAQLLMGRRLRTTLPMLPEALQPCVPDLRQVRHVERERRLRQTEPFNARHRTRNLDKLLPGHSVWITDAKAQGTVTSVHQTPRSYVISGPHGTIRRNRSHLMPIPMSETQTELQLT